MSSLRFAIAFGCLAFVSAENPPALGPYGVGRGRFDVDTLDSTDPSVWVHWPEGGAPGEKFPLVSYNHGAGGGGIAILGYAALFEQIASHGIIIAATRSCALGCRDGAESYGETYAAEQIKVIEWAKGLAAGNSTADMPWAETLDFSHGVAIAGHSMGGEATGINSRQTTAEKHDIRSAIFHQAAILGTAEGAQIAIPSQHMTGSGDGPAARKAIYDGAPSPKVYRNQEGQQHTEPVLIAPNRNPALGPFLAHWVRVYNLGEVDGESYDMLYGDGPSSLCNYAEMAECERAE